MVLPEADQGLLGTLMLAASLAAAGAFAGVAGSALRIGGGIALLPALLAVLPGSPSVVVLPALAVALTVNAVFAAMMVLHQRDHEPTPAPDARLLWFSGGVLGAGLTVAAADGASFVVAPGLIAAGAVMLAPQPAALRRLSGLALKTATLAAAVLSALSGTGAGTLGPMLARAKGAACGYLGVVLAGPAAMLLWAGLLWRDGGYAAWMVGTALVAGAAYLSAPLGTRLTELVPAALLRIAVALMAVTAGFSLLRAAVA